MVMASFLLTFMCVKVYMMQSMSCTLLICKSNIWGFIKVLWSVHMLYGCNHVYQCQNVLMAMSMSSVYRQEAYIWCKDKRYQICILEILKRGAFKGDPKLQHLDSRHTTSHYGETTPTGPTPPFKNPGSTTVFDYIMAMSKESDSDYRPSCLW